MSLTSYKSYLSKMAMLLLFGLIVVSSQPFSASHAQISTEYEANYGLNQTWEDIMTHFITIQATRRR